MNLININKSKYYKRGNIIEFKLDQLELEPNPRTITEHAD